MKAIKYIAAIALLAGLVSCQKEYDAEVQTAPEAHPGMIEVPFTVHFPEPLPVSTKSVMGEGPAVTGFSLGFCLFGAGDGFVQNWQTAELVTPITDAQGHITGGSFTVLLPLSDEKRIVHVIADIPANADPGNTNAANPITNTYIDKTMELLVTGKNAAGAYEGAYWQEIVLENGIRQYLGDDDIYHPEDDVVEDLSNIHLVRNFTKFTVTNEDPSSEKYDGFQVTRWALINVPTMGYVAPYTGNASARFPKGYTNIKNYTAVDALLNQLSGTEEGQDNYPGAIPPDAEIDETFPGDPDGEGAANYTVGGGSQYMYERPLPTSTQKQTAVLVEVEFDADNAVSVAYREEKEITDETVKAKYWYKIEALNAQGQYIPFYRNVAYILKIAGLETAGAATANDAFLGSYFGNISASLETASLNELSDGTSKIHVDLMDYTFLAGGGAPVTLMKDESTAAQFWFVPDVSYPSVESPAAYTQSTSGVCDIKVESVDVAGYDAAITAFTANEDGSIAVTLASTGTKVKKSIIRVSARVGDDEATNPNKYIYRDITINLMETQSFIHANETVTEVTAFDGTPSTTGLNNPVKINIFLPEDLGASVFPIQVRIEAENNTLSATSEDLPVATGKTVFGDGTRNTYFFIRTIEYSEYCHLDSRTKKYVYTYKFPVTFYTSKSGTNANATLIDIRDLGGKFNRKLLGFGVEVPTESEP
ncbi:MAG: hypothetical protein K6F98_04555 [Bacteroidales bacterium]|nr:hypothetical protein [Bacteroidales bacterium]